MNPQQTIRFPYGAPFEFGLFVSPRPLAHVPLRGSATPYFVSGCGADFALVAPIATIFSSMPKSFSVSHLAVRVT